MATRERLAGKRCLVTGGSRNLGRAIACAFAREGARVAITYSTKDADATEATRAIEEAGGREALVFKGSVTDGAHAEATVKAIVAAWDGLDVLVNNAGISQVLPVSLVEEADWDRVMDTNAKGAFLMSRAALRPMIRAKYGRIVNIGAFGDGRVVHAPVHYAASKAALAGFTEALARDVGRYNILVNILQPGILEGGLGRNAPDSRLNEYVEQNPARRFGRFDEIAEAAVFLSSDANAWLTGARMPVDGGA